VVLFAHGSRDPLWSRPIEAIALRMAALQLATKGIMNMIISWHSI
jgi:sirohydrochlorin ferrochelatase